MSPRTHAPLLLPAIFSVCAACQLLDGIGHTVVLASADGGSDATSNPSADASPEPLVDAGAGASADAASATGCPVDAGGVMVRIDVPAFPDASFCIDRTEVTASEFAIYRFRHPSLGTDAPPACADAAPPELPTGDTPEDPARGVSFCFAWDYCKRTGKRLCGKIGGGQAEGGGPTPQISNEWEYVCANGEALTAFPYGNTYDPGICTTGLPNGDTSTVGAHPRCHGVSPPFDQVLDMSGNVAELDDSPTSYVSDDAGDTPMVTVKGGAFAESGAAVGCGAKAQLGMTTSATNFPPDFGFRCCASVR